MDCMTCSSFFPVRSSSTAAQWCAMHLLDLVSKAAPGNVSSLTCLEELRIYKCVHTSNISLSGRATPIKTVSSEQTVVSSGEVTLVM